MSSATYQIQVGEHAVRRARSRAASATRLLACMLAVWLFLGWWVRPAQAATYTVAVVPQFSAVEIHRVWAPLLAQLSAASGHQFQLQTFASIPEFEKSFLAGQPDFVYLNPYHMVMAHRAQRYEPVVREKNQLLSGIVVVRADSPAQSLSDLAGERLAYPAPNSFGASLYIRSLLAERKIPTSAVYVKTHANAYRHVITGSSAAAGGIRATLEREPPDVRQQLRILFETPPVAPHPVAAHPRVDPAAVQALQAAWLQLVHSETGESLLRAIQMPSPQAANYRRDYADLERLHLERFVQLDGD